MGTTLIPWHVFFEGLKKLPEGSRRDEWLQRWRFNEEGAVLTKDTRELETSRKTHRTVG
jgi:hypothetical protein